MAVPKRCAFGREVVRLQQAGVAMQQLQRVRGSCAKTASRGQHDTTGTVTSAKRTGLADTCECRRFPSHQTSVLYLSSRRLFVSARSSRNPQVRAACVPRQKADALAHRAAFPPVMTSVVIASPHLTCNPIHQLGGTQSVEYDLLLNAAVYFICSSEQ
jgi:hypothetical protein